MAMEKRLKYHGRGDLSVGFYLERFKEVIDSLTHHTEKAEYDINSILEFYNALKFLDDGVHDIRWTSEYIQHVKSQKGILHKIIRQFFDGLNTAKMPGILKQLNNEYNDDFITCLEKYDLASKLDEKDFKAVITSSKIADWQVLQSKYLVQNYPSTTKEIFLFKTKNFESFLSNFSMSRRREIFIPGTLSKDEMLVFCNEYIDSEEANVNYVQILSNPIKGLEKYITVDAATRLKARRRAEQLENELFSSRSAGGIEVKMAVLSSQDSYQKELAKSSPTDSIALVDGDWIEKYHDYPTLLNNIQYLYDLFTRELISELPSFPKFEMGVLELHLGFKTANSYVTGQYFSVKQWMAAMKIRALQELLARHDIRIEGVIDWFFTTYCKETFGIKWLPLGMPSPSESIANQTATLFRVEESIRKQYKVFAQNDGKIDPELVNLTNTPSYRELPSLVKKKYVYLNHGDDIQNITNLLFSDQTSVTYINEKLQGHNFIDLIVQNTVKKSDFHSYQIPALEFLLEKNLVKINEDGFVSVVDGHTVKVLKRLYDRGVAAYHHASTEEKTRIDELLSNGWLTEVNTLLSKPEMDYFNFMLNNSTFDNSWSIRNNYQHGIPNYNNQDHYKFDNSMALLILLTHIVKIHDELSLKELADGKDGLYCEIVG